MAAVLFRNISISAVLCMAQIAFFFVPSSSAEDLQLFQKNRELAAKSYELRDSQLLAARIGLRRWEPERNWLSRALGAPREEAGMEVVAHMKSGDLVVIDRIRGSTAVDPIILDGAGSVVGYVQYRASEDDNWTTHRVTFVLYLVAPKGLLRREGEAKCRKVGEEGRPYVRASNARWDPESRELHFTLRSKCYHVHLFGSGSRYTFNMVTGEFRLDPDLKEHPTVETAQRLIVSFDTRGDTFDFDVAKAGTGSRRAFLKCVEDARAGPSFRICGDTNPRQALWQFGAERVSYELCRSGSDTVAKTYVVRACHGAFTSSNSSWITFSIANQDAPRGIEALIECSCNHLTVDRLAFNPEVRTLSFNLETDAKAIKFAGGEFQVPNVASRSHDGKLSMQIPVFTIRFNEQWQIVEMTAVGDAPATASVRKMAK